MEMANFLLPPKLDLTDGNPADGFRKWKRQLEVYLEASRTTNKPKQRHTAIILHCAGRQALEVYDRVQFDREKDKQDPEKVLEKPEGHYKPPENEVLQKFFFWNITFCEPFNVFVTELYSHAASCNFKKKDRMVGDKIVFSVSSKLEELLLRETGLDLKKATEICRSFEITPRSNKEMGASSEAHKFDKVAEQNKLKEKSAVKPQQKYTPPPVS